MSLPRRLCFVVTVGLLAPPELRALRLSRRQILRESLKTSALGALLGLQNAQPALAIPFFGSDYQAVTNKPGFQTPAGVKYYDLKEGAGRQPRWGETVVIRYRQYIQRRSGETPTKIDDFGGSTFVFKHGNGRQIEGLEDGVHTMKVGGVRRLLVPARLAYTGGNVGPIPRSTMEIKKLEDELDRMESTGQIILDVSLINAFRDEADRGYYDDDVPGTSETGVPRSVIREQAATDAL